MCHAPHSVTVAEDLAGNNGGIICGLLPMQSRNGVDPVDLFTVLTENWVKFVENNSEGWVPW